MRRGTATGGAYRTNRRGTGRQDPSRAAFLYTWRWENHPERGTEDTIVTVEFLDCGRSTELVLTHERFETIESRNEHDKGWNGCLEMLARYISERSRS
jgi:uncharacterized protein YndB with AHSA1/START domain